MKTIFRTPVHRNIAGSKRAHTLVEMMVTMGVFSFVVIAFVYVNLFGIKQDELAESKLGASDSARRGFNKLALDVRSAKIYQIGNFNGTTFTNIADGNAQIGNAMLLNLTTNLNSCILYYFKTNECQLWRTSNVTPSTMVVQYLTNSMYFSCEDYAGNVRNTRTHKGVINVMLQFAQYQYPLTKVGSNYLYDYYKMQFKLTPHVPDGP